METKTLDGNSIDVNKTTIKQNCCSACFYAKNDDCNCKCNGAFHGLGRKGFDNKLLKGEIIVHDWQLPEAMTSLLQKARCRFDDVDLSGESIRGYPHDAGWKVKNFEELYWLYIVCPKCHHQWSLKHLGVARQ